jgi:TonB family protein
MVKAMPRLQTTAGAGTLAQTALSLLMGAGFTSCLFLGMARYANLVAENPPPEIEDLRAVAIPFQPPPPPRVTPTEATAAPEISNVTGFDLSPSDSPVKIAVSPTNLDTFNSANQLAPPAMIRIGQLYGEFKPRIDIMVDPQHVFQENEVDRIPSVLYREPPIIPGRFTRDGKSVHVTLLLVVDANGVVGDVKVVKSSGDAEVDAIVVENIKTWGFSPAIKRGKKVRCMLQQPYLFVQPHHSAFES